MSLTTKMMSFQEWTYRANRDFAVYNEENLDDGTILLTVKPNYIHGLDILSDYIVSSIDSSNPDETVIELSPSGEDIYDIYFVSPTGIKTLEASSNSIVYASQFALKNRQEQLTIIIHCKPMDRFMVFHATHTTVWHSSETLNNLVETAVEADHYSNIDPETEYDNLGYSDDESAELEHLPV